MNKPLYLFSLALLIASALASILLGIRYAFSPVVFLQLASLANSLLPAVIGLLLALFLSVRFMDVLRGRFDIGVSARRPVARAARLAGAVLVWLFYGIALAVIGFLVYGGGSLAAEVRFLVAPLLRTLPVGMVLFELSHLLDLGTASEQPARGVQGQPE